MPARRSPFGSQYGTAKGEQPKPKGKLPPPQTTAPVPLPITGQPEMGQPMPMQPGQAQGLSPEDMLRQLLMAFTGGHGGA